MKRIVLSKGRDQGRTGLHVPAIHHLHRRVGVPAGDGDAAGIHTPAGLMNGPRVGAAGTDYIPLIGNALYLGQILHAGHHRRVADHGVVHDFNGRALPCRAAVAVRGLRGIAGDGYIHCNAVVRVNAVGGGAGSPKAQLFLNGKDKIEVVGALLQPLQRHQQDHAGDAVVRIGGENPLTGAAGWNVIDGGIANLNQSFRLCPVLGADVQKEIVNPALFGLVAGFPLALLGYRAAGPIFESHRRPRQIVGRQAPQLAKAQKALIVNVGAKKQ